LIARVLHIAGYGSAIEPLSNSKGSCGSRTKGFGRIASYRGKFAVRTSTIVLPKDWGIIGLQNRLSSVQGCLFPWTTYPMLYNIDAMNHSKYVRIMEAVGVKPTAFAVFKKY